MTSRDSGQRSRFWELGTGYRALEALIALGWLLSMTSLGAAQKPLDDEALPNLRVTIWVHDYAHTRPSTLVRAEREATRILAEAGVNLVWQSYSPWPGDAGTESAAQAVPDASNIHLSIVADSKAYPLAHEEETLGITPMAREGERDTLAVLFLDRVRYQADQRWVSVGLLLGHAIAHELGHLLLRTSGHSSAGVMRGGWTPGDLRRVACGQLLFTPQQALLIRNEVRERAQQQAATQVATGTALK